MKSHLKKIFTVALFAMVTLPCLAKPWYHKVGDALDPFGPGGPWYPGTREQTDSTVTPVNIRKLRRGPDKALHNGNVGRIAFMNTWKRPVTVSLFHPDSNAFFKSYQIPAGKNIYLGPNIGSDWGLQLESGQVYLLQDVADFNLYQGHRMWQSWPERLGL